MAREKVDVAELFEHFTEPGMHLIASGVTLEDYLEDFAEHYCEYVEGNVYREMPIHLRHERLRFYLIELFRIYFLFQPIGEVLWEPTMMFQPRFPNRRREPDVMVVLNDGQATIENTRVNGAADIAIEIVSPASIQVDREDKFQEYEQSGVGEYWLIDYVRRDAQFYRLDENGIFRLITPNADGNYTSSRLSKLTVHVPTLWEETLPNPLQVIETVQAMLKE